MGIGTLYRHFPTREALIEAAYRNELAKLCDAAPELLATLPAGWAAVRAWMDRFVDYLALRAGHGRRAASWLIASGANPYAHSRDAPCSPPWATLLAAGVAAGTVRADVWGCPPMCSRA